MVLFIGSFVLPSFVSAAYETPVQLAASNGANAVFDPIKDMFSSWEEGQLSPNIAKYLFFFLLMIVIYAVAGVIPFAKKGGIRIIFSAIVAFLATAYFTPADIYILMSTYGAMGFAVAVVIPFSVLFYFTYMAARKADKSSPIVIFMNYAAWIMFSIWLLYKLIWGWSSGVIGGLEFWFFLFGLILSLGMIFFNKQVRDRIFNFVVGEKKEAALKREDRIGAMEEVEDKKADRILDRRSSSGGK